MNLKLTILLNIVIEVSFLFPNVDGIRCFVCGDEGELPCKNFEATKDTYAKDCGPLEKGCRRITQADSVKRSCTDVTIEDCQKANGIEYCFCTHDLCNDIGSRFINPTDDEDLLEGSGIRTISTVTEKPKKTVILNTNTGFKAEISQCVLLLSFIFSVQFNE